MEEQSKRKRGKMIKKEGASMTLTHYPQGWKDQDRPRKGRKSSCEGKKKLRLSASGKLSRGKTSLVKKGSRRKRKKKSREKRVSEDPRKVS